MREAVFTARARLKQAELEAEQWKEELRRLQAHSQEQGQQIHILRQERQASQERTNRLVAVLTRQAGRRLNHASLISHADVRLLVLRLQHEISLLQQQLCESRELIHSLQSELQVYDRVCSSSKARKGQHVRSTLALETFSHYSWKKLIPLLKEFPLKFCALLSSGDPFWDCINIDIENSKYLYLFQKVIVR